MSERNSTIFYFCRHGECMGNISRTNLHPDEAILTPNGKIQAGLLGDHLQNENFTAAFASPYARALETAQIVLSKSKISQAHLEKTNDLREQNLGIYEGSGIKEILQDFADSQKDFCDWIAPSGECHADIMIRIDRFLQGLYTKYVDTPKQESASSSPKIILVVTHGGVLHHLWKFFNNSATYNFNGWSQDHHKVMRNCAYFKIEIEAMAPQHSNVRQLHLLEAHGRQHLKSLEVDTLHKATIDESHLHKFRGCLQQ